MVCLTVMRSSIVIDFYIDNLSNTTREYLNVALVNLNTLVNIFFSYRTTKPQSYNKAIFSVFRKPFT